MWERSARSYFEDEDPATLRAHLWDMLESTRAALGYTPGVSAERFVTC